MPRSVRDYLTSRVVTVRPDAPVSRAVDLMRTYGFSALPVADAAYRLVGMISLLDVLRFRESRPGVTDAAVSEVMTTDVLWMPPTAAPDVVAHRMRTYGELRVMPIAERGVLVGVVTRSDLLGPPKRPGAARRVLDRLTLRGGGTDADADTALARLVRPRRFTGVPPDGTPIGQIMATDVVAVTPGHSLVAAEELLARHRFTALPVVEGDGRLVGLLSEADVLGDPLWERSERRTVAAVMTREPITLDVGATVGDARRLVADRGIRVLPVVEGSTLVGVVARSDLV